MFGVGDVILTVAGIALFGAVEANPTVAPLLDAHGYGVLVVLKAVALLGFWFLYAKTPEEFDAGVPLGLSLLGAAVVGWNVAVVLTLVQT